MRHLVTGLPVHDRFLNPIGARPRQKEKHKMSFRFSATVAYFICTATIEQLQEKLRAAQLEGAADIEDCGPLGEREDERKYRFIVNLEKCPFPGDWQNLWSEAFKEFESRQGKFFRDIRWYINKPN